MNHFFALPLPPQVRDHVAATADRWRGMLPPGVDARWYPPDEYHVTLKFLGDVVPERAQDLIPAAWRIADGWEPFPVRLAPAGGFPDLRRPFVLWAGVETTEALSRLASAIGVSMEREGFAHESRPYRPHITLARCRVPRHEPPIQTAPEHERAFPAWQAVGFALMQTASPERHRIGPNPRYNTVHLFPFGTPPSSAE